MGAATADLKNIFAQAMDLHAPTERAAYLDAACADHPTLRAEVESLLAAHQAGARFFKDLRICPNATIDEPNRERLGSMVGPYKLLEQIGEGGMGVVFMAEQSQPLRRKVALKVIKPGMDSKQVIARFEAERQALALMDHPNIARVIDAGATESGRPYFVMELVKGIPITEYCDQTRLTTGQRLELFQRVCLAVQHAHQKGIIHRDLKPGNVLVTLHDGEPVPKVIDFGIAKATGQQLTEKTMFTRFAQMVGTPLYMSPEQAALSATDVDTRSDVYSLGVLLYELLTGTTPFESDTLKRAGHDEMRRIIREDDPPRPSTRLTTMEQAALSTICERRSAEPRKLNQQVRGDLDWVVMKALEKDRDRRYESASALAADVQRYLSEDAVEACPPSAGYRLRKYLRRNRQILVPMCAIGAVLISATAVSTWLAVDAVMSRRLADERLENEKKAQSDTATEAAIARAVNAFLQEDLLGQVATAPPDWESDGNRLLTVKQALDRAAARLGQRFQDQPLVEAAIRTAIGTGYHNLYEFLPALPQLERALLLRKAHLGPDHSDTRDSMSKLATEYMWLGMHSESIELSQQLLENRRAVFSPDNPETMGCVAELAQAYEYAGQLETSARLREQLLEQQRTINGATHPATLSAMHQLAWTYGLMNRFPESLTLFEKFFTLRNTGFGRDWLFVQYVTVCQLAGKYDQVDKPLREALKQRGEDQGSMGERTQMANLHGFLALNLLLQERYDEAEPLAREAVAMNRTGDTKFYYWVSVLGSVLLGQRKYAEAEPLLLKGYEGMKQAEVVHPVPRRRRTEVSGWIVRLYEATNQPEKARAWRQKLDGSAKTTEPPKTRAAEPE